MVQVTNLVAVIPEFDAEDERVRCFYSHMGSTYDGKALCFDIYSVVVLDEIYISL